MLHPTLVQEHDHGVQPTPPPRPHPPLRPRGSSFDLEALRAGLRGTLIQPGDPDYDAARTIHNTAFDREPVAIVKAAGTGDVVASVEFASETGLELAVRAGGHSVAGHSTVDGGIVLDVSGMKGLHIDPVARIAWAQPGLTAAEYSIAAAAHGLATPFGDTGSVGIAGLTLGGGIGWLVRKHGLAIDALRAVEIVTADGRLLTADAEHHPDLFWAVRGGGGNFGVVTRFQYDLYPLDGILGGAIVLPATADVLRALVPIATAAPEELTTISFLMPLPPMPFVPAERVGEPSLVVMFVWSGDPADGPAAISPFRAIATPIAEAVMPMPYPGIYGLTAQGEVPARGIIRSRFLSGLDEGAIEAILEAGTTNATPGSMIQIRVLGGQMARVAPDATAFAHREAPVMVAVMSHFGDPADEPRERAWVDALHAALAPVSIGVYSNFLEDEGDARVREAYPEATYRRLVDVKRRYDPSNLFRLNQNIRPTGR